MLIRGSSPVVCLGLLVSGAIHAQQYTITTLAGNGTAGFLDGSDLTAVQFNNPNAITVDAKGAVYIADTGGQRIRLISGGAASTIGGNGTAGYTPGSGSATTANLWGPGGIVVAADGTVYIAETTNHVVRKISGGNISTFAGTASPFYSGDNGPALQAQLTGPTGLTLDSAGNLYIADSGNNLIRRVSKDGIIISYVGGTGPTANSLRNPTGICVDSSGALYIADSDHHRIARYANGALTTVAGNGSAGFGGDGGAAIKAQLSSPTGVAVDAAGNLYIADKNNSRIRKVTPGGNIYTIAGSGQIGYGGDNGLAASASLYFPRGVAVGSDGKVYIADTANSVIRLLTPALPTAIGVSNAASFLSRISPGALASIFGANFGSITAQGDLGLLTNALPTNLGSVGVTVNGAPAPLLYVSPTQINFQVPWKAQAASNGNAAVTVTVNGGDSNVVQVPMQTAAPGLFTLGTSAIVQNADFTLNDPTHPAAPGSTIVAYLTGSGPISQSIPDGAPTPNSPLTQITAATSARIGDSTATVSFSGLTPGFVGLVQFNIVVPGGIASGTYPLTVTIDGQTSNAGNIVVK